MDNFVACWWYIYLFIFNSTKVGMDIGGDMIPNKFTSIVNFILFNFTLECSDTMLKKVCLNGHVILYNYARKASGT